MDLEHILGILFVVSIFGIIAAGFGWKFFREMTEWNKLHAQFPAHIQGAPLAKYKKAISRIGKADFDHAKGKVSVTGAGFLLEMTNPLMKDIFLPYEQVQNVRRSSLLGHHFVQIGCGYSTDSRNTLVKLTLPGQSWDILVPYIDPQLVKQSRNLNSMEDFITFTKDTMATAKNNPTDLGK